MLVEVASCVPKIKNFINTCRLINNTQSRAFGPVILVYFL